MYRNNSQMDGVLASFDGHRGELIPLLQRVQEEFGYLSEEAMAAVARHTRVPEGSVYGIATFYAQFHFKPIGRRRVMVCRGTACHVRGAPRILEAFEQQLGIKQGETTPGGEHSLETVACIGACSLAPCVMTNKKVEAKLTPRKIARLLGRDKEKKEKE